jgi:uncharacterized membrane protein
MKKYFRAGLALLIPLALVYQVLIWIYRFSEGIVLDLIPASLGYQWWYPLVAIIGVAVIIFLIGLIFSWITPVRWVKKMIDKHILNKIPIINTIYKFGTDVSDSFISDIKQNGDLKIVELMFAGQPSLGVLTDEKNNIVFVPTAPNPLNGFIMRTKEYRVIDMTFTDLVKSLASLGRINGDKWK